MAITTVCPNYGGERDVWTTSAYGDFERSRQPRVVNDIWFTLFCDYRL